MKKISIILLFSLIHNAYSTINPNDLNKIKTIWNYFTSDGKSMLHFFINNLTNKVKVIKNDNSFIILNDVDSELLYIIMDKYEHKVLSQEKKAEIEKIEDEWNKLLNKGFTNEQCCNQLLGKIVTKNGCALPPPSKDEIIELLTALLKQKMLNDTFN